MPAREGRKHADGKGREQERNKYCECHAVDEREGERGRETAGGKDLHHEILRSSCCHFQSKLPETELR